MENKRTELLAPAGSYEAFEAAIGAGADAVYVGGEMFGARAYAKNFGQEELLAAIDAAHIHNKKLYLTVNTLLKNKEQKGQLYEYLAPFYEADLDAVIVQDLGVFSFLKREFPDLPLHASTQMTITGPAGMKFLESLGAARVVAARELSLSELSAMHEASPIEIEAFVHGALCYSYSGQCLMSSLLGGRSGNRGRCAQPCRLPYQPSLPGKKIPGKSKKEWCPLSLKDICTIDILPQILEAGVMSLKIEGRMKQPGYTAGVTGIYRKYLDKLEKYGSDHYFVEEGDRKYLLELFSRGGSCTGYYQMQNGPSMMAFDNEKKTGEVRAEIIKRKEKIYGNLILFPGSPAILEVTCNGYHASAACGEVQYAKNQPMEEERIRSQMEKLGNTPFVWEKLEIRMDSQIFVPVKILNEVRREALLLLEEEIRKSHRRNLTGKPFLIGEVQNRPKRQELPVYVSCEKKETAEALCRVEGIRGMYLSADAMESCLEEGLSRGLEMYLALPHMVRGRIPGELFEKAKAWLDQGMRGFLVRNLEAYAFLRQWNPEVPCVLDHSVYTWNDEAVAFWREQGILRDTIPLELNEGELRHRDNRSSEILVYGYLPLMLSAQCVRKNVYGCAKAEECLKLKDRYGKEFPVVCVCRPWKVNTTEERIPCYNIVYNSLPYGLLKEKKQVEALGVRSVRLSFTIEKEEEAKEILKEFLEVYCFGKNPSSVREFTKGHFKRGAE